MADSEGDSRRRRARRSRRARDGDAATRRRRRRPSAAKRRRERAGPTDAEPRRPARAAEGRRAELARAGEALREGGGQTGRQLRGAGAKATGLLGSAVTDGLGLLGGLYRGLVSLFLSTADRSRGPVRGLRHGFGGGLARLATILSPARGLALAAIGCALLLGLSQFADYRGVAVGGDNFLGEIGTVAPPPEVDRLATGQAHFYAFVPIAMGAVALLALAYSRRRWQLTRAAAAIGLAAVVVSVLIDRPQGLDEGSIARDFVGAEAQLLGGYWAQLFAGVGLAVTSILFGRELRGAPAPVVPTTRSRRPVS